MARWLRYSDDWLGEPDLRHAVRYWFEDAEVQKGLQDMPSERKWLQPLISDPAVSDKLLLTHVTTAVARLWYETLRVSPAC